MGNKVRIAIKGVRSMDGEQEPVDEAGLGEHYIRKGKHYIIWRHEEGIAKRIKITKTSMTVTEADGGNAMDFEKGRRCCTLYQTSAGKLPLEIMTREFRLREEGRFLEAEMEYSLYHGDTHISDNRIKVMVAFLEDLEDKSTGTPAAGT